MSKETYSILLGVGIEIVFWVLGKTMDIMPLWLEILGYICGGGLIIYGAVGFIVPKLQRNQKYDNKETNEYLHALSLDGIHLNSDDYMQFVLELSNSLDKPLTYEVDLDNSYTEINGERQVQLERGKVRHTISNKKQSWYQLPRFVLPKVFPCNALVHYEILYGSTEKFTFRRVHELGIKANSAREIGNWVIKKEDDSPIRK